MHCENRTFRKENLWGQSVLCYLPYGCLGREVEYKKLDCMMENRIPVVLNGVAGVGKTALCAYYYKKRKELDPNFFMLYVDVSGCRGIESFSQFISSAIDLDESVDLKYITEYLVEHCEKYQAILFDNWEELQCAMVGTSSWDMIRDFMNLLANYGIKILLSSQEKALNGWKELNLTELKENDGRELLEQLLLCRGKEVKEGDDKEKQAFEQLLRCMENHPLTMVLTASLVEGRYYDLSRIQNRWSEVYNETEFGRHRSLRTALKMSFNAVSNVNGATLLWGIISEIAVDFPVSFMELLKEVSPDIVWDDAERALVHRCLIRNTEMQGLQMLMPVKVQWKYLAGNELQSKCLEKWGALLPSILWASDAPGHTHNPQKSNSLKKEVILAMGSFMKITETLVGKGLIKQATVCVEAMEPYYELIAGQGIVFLEKLPIKKFSQKTQGIIYKCKADIIRLKEGDEPERAQKLYETALSCFEECGDDSGIAYVKSTMGLNFLWNYKDGKKALKCFEESESLSRKYGLDMYLAEALKNKGIVLTNEFSENDKAQICYKEAGVLYEKMGDYRGLAHVTKRIGVIEWNNGKVDAAIEQFEKALFLYQQAHYVQGMADTISRLCLAYMDKGDEKKIQKVYNDGKKIFDTIPYEVTRKDLKKNMDLAQTWLSR